MWYCSLDVFMIYVKVGFGFFLEMIYEEVLVFIEKKVFMINFKIEVFIKDVVKIKVYIKFVL